MASGTTFKVNLKKKTKSYLTWNRSMIRHLHHTLKTVSTVLQACAKSGTNSTKEMSATQATHTKDLARPQPLQEKLYANEKNQRQTKALVRDIGANVWAKEDKKENMMTRCRGRENMTTELTSKTLWLTLLLFFFQCLNEYFENVKDPPHKRHRPN